METVVVVHDIDRYVYFVHQNVPYKFSNTVRFGRNIVIVCCTVGSRFSQTLVPPKNNPLCCLQRIQCIIYFSNNEKTLSSVLGARAIRLCSSLRLRNHEWPELVNLEPQSMFPVALSLSR